MNLKDLFFINSYSSVSIEADNGESYSVGLCSISIYLISCLNDKSCKVVHISFREDMKSPRECINLVWFSLCKFKDWGSFHHADGEKITRQFVHNGTDDCFELLKDESNRNAVILRKCNIHEVIPDIGENFVNTNEMLHDQAKLSQYAEYKELKVKYKESLKKAASWMASDFASLYNSIEDDDYDDEDDYDDDDWDEDEEDEDEDEDNYDEWYDVEHDDND